MRFEPDGPRAAALDRRMHRELATSLSRIGDAARGKLDFDHAALGRMVDVVLAGGSVTPGTFARYYEIVRALETNDRDRAARSLREVAGSAPARAGLAIRTLAADADDSDDHRYLTLLRDEGETGAAICAPSPDAASAFATRLADGLALLDKALPTLAAEIWHLVREVTLIASRPGAPTQVDGGSHYQLWGALFLNVRFHRDPIAIVEVLAHETAHSLLFGLCVDEPLVRNPATERFASPLRADLRPMDGIFHATFVAARMHWAMSRLAEHDGIGADDRARAAAAARQDVAHFRAGHEVVERHARMTALGRSIMDATTDYMRSAA